MNEVITSEQARKITHGRTPLVPVEYEAAVKALAECIALDDTKYWSDKADALAAWSRIYHDGKTLRQAKQLKLRAFRRMGELAGELHPRLSTKGAGVGRGSIYGSGPINALKRVGLSHAEADASRLISKLPVRKFNHYLNSQSILSPTTLRNRELSNWDDNPWAQIQRDMRSLRLKMRVVKSIGFSLTEIEKKNAIELIREITDWFDEFERSVKVKP